MNILKYEDFLVESSKIRRTYTLLGISDWNDIAEEILNISNYYVSKYYTIVDAHQLYTVRMISLQIAHRHAPHVMVAKVNLLYTKQNNIILTMYMQHDDNVDYANRRKISINIKKGTTVNELFDIIFKKISNFAKTW